VLVGGTHAVGVAVGAETGLAVVGDHGFLKGANVWLDGLGVDAPKERIGIGANLHVIDADAGEDVDRIVPPAPYMESTQNFIWDLAMRSRSAKLSMALR
jgi:hypothetical protein